MNWSTLGEECEVVGGGTPSRARPEFFGGTIPWATPTDVTRLNGKRILRETAEAITNEGLDSSSAKLLPAGAVLLTSRATIGFTAVAAVPMATNQGFANFICGPRLLPEFLAMWLPSQRDRMLQLAGGTTFKEISKTTLKSFPVPVPSLEEQRRIVDLLNRTGAIKRLAEQAQAKARELISAVFVHLVGDPASNPQGWRYQPVLELLALPIRNGLSPARNGTHDGEVLTLTAITRGVFDPDARKTAKFSTRPSPFDFVDDRDFLICRGNGNPDLVARGVLVSTSMPATVFPDTAMALRPDPSVLVPGFLASVWNTAFVREQIRTRARTTNGTYKVNQTGVGSVLIPVPPIDVQQDVVARLEETADIRQLAHNAAEVASRTNAALMARLFA